MFKRFAIRSLAVLASLIAISPASAAEFPIKSVTQEGITVHPLKIPITAAINDFSAAIPSCANMSVYWERGNSAQVTMYPADSDDDTVAEVEANTAIKVFTTNERYGPFTPTKAYVRFVVDTVNASVPSHAKVTCSNFAANAAEGEFYVEKYGGKTLTAINAAIDACDDWAQANNTKGTVILPAGKTTIVASTSTSPLISMPEKVAVDTTSYNSTCDLKGYGSTKDYDGTGDSVGSSLVVWYPALMTATNGIKTVIYAPGHNQILSDFNIVMTGDNGTHVDNAYGIFSASSTAGSRTFGANGIKHAKIDNVVVSSAQVDYGIGFGSIFWLDNTLINSWFSGLEHGYEPITMAATSNNANFIAGNRFSNNTNGIYIDGGLACQDMYLHRNTIEGNHYGIRMTSTGSCRISSYGTHWEQLQANSGVNDVLIEGTLGSFSSFGDFFDSDLAAGGHIVRTGVQAAGTNDDVVVGANFRDNTAQPFTYAAGAKIQISNATSWARTRLPNSTTLPTDCEIGDMYMDTDATSGSRLYLCQASDTWAAVADGVGAASGGDPLSIDNVAVVDASGVDLISSIGVKITSNTGISPDSATFDFERSYLLSDNLGMAAEDCVFTRDGTGGGGFLCEGTATGTTEQLYLFPAVNGSDTTSFIATGNTAITFAGPTAARTVTLPDANFTVARTDAANTFTGVQTMTSPVFTTPALGTPSALVLNASNTSGALDLAGGTIQGGVNTVIDAAATIGTLTTAGTNGDYYLVTTAGTITLPAITQSGLSVCFQSLAAIALVIDSNASDGIRLPGASSPDTDGDSVDPTTPTAGDLICFLSRDNGTSDEWVASGVRGDWAAN